MSKHTRALTPPRAAPVTARIPGPAAKSNGTSEPLVMTLGEILSLYNDGIGNMKVGSPGLNGYQKAVGEGIILQPYSLTDEVRQHITKCRFILRPYFEEIDKEERQRITSEVMDGDPTALHVPKDDERRQALWHKLYADALEVEHTIHGLHIFKREDFFRENKNPIPNVCEEALYPITDGSPWRLAHEGQLGAQAAAKPTDPPGGEAD